MKQLNVREMNKREMIELLKEMAKKLDTKTLMIESLNDNLNYIHSKKALLTKPTEQLVKMGRKQDLIYLIKLYTQLEQQNVISKGGK